jgi:hypothetical protein
MPVCAACKHVQTSGDACDVCGRPFFAAAQTSNTPAPSLRPAVPARTTLPSPPGARTADSGPARSMTPGPVLRPQTTPTPTLRPQTTPTPTLRPQTTPAPTLRPQTTPEPALRPQTTPLPVLRPQTTPAPVLRPQTTPDPRPRPQSSTPSALLQPKAPTAAAPEMPAEWTSAPPADERLPGLEPTGLADSPIVVGEERLSELETTALGDPSSGVPVTRMAELDLGREVSLDLGPVVTMPDLERHAAGSVPTMPVEIVPVERTGLAERGAPTPQSATVRCPECEHEQAPTLYCEACGHRLQALRPPPPATTDGSIPCEGCSVPVQPGTMCRNCGVFNRSLEA